jgi:hypothetical protein
VVRILLCVQSVYWQEEMVEAKKCCFCGKAARSNAPKTKLLYSLDGLKEASASECTAHMYHLICVCGRVSVSQYRPASRSQPVPICLSLSVFNYPSPPVSICLPLASCGRTCCPTVLCLTYDQLQGHWERASAKRHRRLDGNTAEAAQTTTKS